MQKKGVLFLAGQYLASTVPVSNLSGVKYDVVAIEKRLIQIGFNVERYEDVHKDKYIPALQKMVEKSPNDAIHIVYFSGHGGHYNGKNYIFPSDFGVKLDILKDIDGAAINIEDIISVFKNKGRLILILDACRSDVGQSKGYFAEMTSAENVYIAYGTMFQDTSIGNEKAMSWFTEAICDEILTPNIDVGTLFTKVRQNMFTKHYVQIPPSVDTILDKVVLHSKSNYDDTDKQVHNFIKKYADKYIDKHGYFHGDDLIFIDAAQYFDIGLLDAIWKFKKVENKTYMDKGVNVPQLPEAESKLISFLNFEISSKFFSYDESHTWYYNGRQIRMGEIPPLPLSLQKKLPEQGKELFVEFNAVKEDVNIIIRTNLPETSELFVWNNKIKTSQKHLVSDGKIIINSANNISKVVIDCCVFTTDAAAQQVIGEKCRNLVGQFIKYHPIYGNQVECIFEF